MTQALVVHNPSIQWGAAPPAIVEDQFSKVLGDTVGAALADVFGGFRQLSFANNCFHIRDGKSKNTLMDTQTGAPQQQLFLVVLNIAPQSHCSWWDKEFQPGSDVQPTAVWLQNQAPPAHVPEWVMTTKKDGKFKHYQVRRRCVVALLGSNAQGGVTVEAGQPIVMDLGESSLFMPDAPPLYSFMGILKMCQQYNCMPYNMLLKLQFDYTGKGAPNTVRFCPALDEANNPRFFAPELAANLRAAAASPEIIRMLDIKLKLEANQPTVAPMSPAVAAMAPAYAAPVAPSVAPPQAPPQAPPAQAYAAPVAPPVAPPAPPAYQPPVAPPQPVAPPAQPKPRAKAKAQAEAPAVAPMAQPVSPETAAILAEAQRMLAGGAPAPAPVAPPMAPPAPVAPPVPAPQASQATGADQAALANRMADLLNGL